MSTRKLRFCYFYNFQQRRMRLRESSIIFSSELNVIMIACFREKLISAKHASACYRNSTETAEEPTVRLKVFRVRKLLLLSKFANLIIEYLTLSPEWQSFVTNNRKMLGRRLVKSMYQRRPRTIMPFKRFPSVMVCQIRWTSSKASNTNGHFIHS